MNVLRPSVGIWSSVVVSALLAACGDSDPTEGHAATEGPIVEVSASEVTDPPELELVERLRLGLDSVGGYLLAHIADIEVSDGGDIFVLDPVRSEVVRFDSLGNVVTVFGGRGRGPGEFTGARYLALSPDTVFVLGSVLLHAFSLDGDVLYADRIDELATGRTPFHELLWAEDGLLAFRRTTIWRIRDGGEFTDSIIVQARSSASGSFEDTGLRLHGRTLHRRGSSYWPRLFSGDGAYDVTSEGKIVYAQGNRYLLDVFSDEGVLLKHVRASVPRREVDGAERERFIERALASWGDDTFPGAPAGPTSEDVHSVPYSRWRAALGRVMGGDDGSVLVERMDVQSEHPLPRAERESTWDLIGLDGTVHGRVTLPAGFKPFAFRMGALYGSEDMGLIPTVVRYELVGR